MAAHNGSGNPRRRLLIISYHFPPDGAVGGLRWSGMSKYLTRRGWEIHVITAAAQDGQPAVHGLTVHHCPRRVILNDVYNDWSSRLRASSSPSNEPHHSESTVGAPAPSPAPAPRFGVLQWVRLNISGALIFPDESRGWILRAAAKARQLLRSYEFDAVVSSGPPHGAHMAGALACVGFDCKLWFDLRDPWAWWQLHNWSPSLFSRDGLLALIPWLEGQVFRRGTGIVSNTASFAEILRAKYPKLGVSHIPNGIDPERLPAPSTDKFAGLSIAYAGTLYIKRDLSPVLRALADFAARNPEARSAVKLRVAGAMDARNEAHFWQEVAATNTRDMIEVLGRVSGAEALDLINRSHLTLVLAQDQPVQVPAKLYECVAMQVHTLVIGEETSAAASEARRIGAMSCESTDIDGIREIIEELWRNPSKPVTPAAAIGYDRIAADMGALLLGNRSDLAATSSLYDEVSTA